MNLTVNAYGLPVDVYIYASGRETELNAPRFWLATYLGFVHCKDSEPGSHPDGIKYHPKSTEKYPLDNEGHWGLFWEVKDLSPASQRDFRPIDETTGYARKRRYGKFFVPEGPILIEHPGRCGAILT